MVMWLQAAERADHAETENARLSALCGELAEQRDMLLGALQLCVDEWKDFPDHVVERVVEKNGALRHGKMDYYAAVIVKAARSAIEAASKPPAMNCQTETSSSVIPE
jgi:hypothetical protein